MEEERATYEDVEYLYEEGNYPTNVSETPGDITEFEREDISIKEPE